MRSYQKKICILGDFAVGKTSLVRRYVEGAFDDKYLSTIGIKISHKLLSRPEYTLNLLFWDLAGGEEFSGHDRNYLRGAAGALLVGDVTRPETFEVLSAYAKQLAEISPGAQLVIAVNKADLLEGDAPGNPGMESLSRTVGGQALLTSAKTGDNVERLIDLLADKLVPGGQFA